MKIDYKKNYLFTNLKEEDLELNQAKFFFDE